MESSLPERPLVGEPLSLDLVNTEWVEAGAPRDLLAIPGGLDHWLRQHGLDGDADTPSLAAALNDTRATLRRCLASDDADGEARVALNGILEHGCVVPRLDEAGAGEAIEVEPAWSPAWAAARDYVELRARWPRWRVRACAHPECILYFLDTTRNGTRRWCDMRTCGNRAKARRYQQRHRK